MRYLLSTSPEVKDLLTYDVLVCDNLEMYGITTHIQHIMKGLSNDIILMIIYCNIFYKVVDNKITLIHNYNNPKLYCGCDLYLIEI